MSTGKSLVCVRCQKQLPAGITYCVACGCQNDADNLISRQLDIENQLTKREGERSFLRNLFAIFSRRRR